MKPLILASQSPRRKALLEKAGIPFIVEVSHFKEYMDTSLAVSDLAKQLSLGKAKTIASKYKGEKVMILAADTIVEFQEQYLGKPTSYQDAFQTLQKLRGNVHIVVTGFTIIDLPQGKVFTDFDKGTLYFKDFSDDLIKEYLDKQTFLDKAGGYAIQELDKRYIEHVEGDRDSIIGLPVKKVIAYLNKLGIE